VPVQDIAASIGIKVISQRYPDSSVSGFYIRRGSERVIGVNANHPIARRRFTIAHELGHVLLLAHDDLHVDGNLILRNATSSQGIDRREIEANAFAAELLMPVDMLREEIRRRGGIDLNDDRVVGDVASAFGVSVQALLIRLSDRAFVVTGGSIASG